MLAARVRHIAVLSIFSVLVKLFTCFMPAPADAQVLMPTVPNNTPGVSNQSTTTDLTGSGVTPGAALFVKDYVGANTQTRTMTCSTYYGGNTATTVYGGSVTQTRTLLSTGEWGPWSLVSSASSCTITTTATQTAACDSGMAGALTQRRITVTTDAGATVSDSGWLTTSSTCAAYNTGVQSETQTVICPNNQSGSITETRNYQLWSDGSKRNYDTWYVSSNTCVSGYASTGYNYQALSCPGSQEGLIIQQQSYSIDSNGNSYNYSDYATISSTCRDYESQTFIPEQVTVSDCASGQVGSNTYTRTYTQWTTGDRTNYTGWTWLSGSCYTPYSDPGPSDSGGTTYSDPGTTDTGTTTADTGTTSAPADTYSPPAETYSPPAETYSPPAETYSPPAETYSPPAETYSPPAETYSPPADPPSLPYPDYPDWCCGSANSDGGWGVGPGDGSDGD